MKKMNKTNNGSANPYDPNDRGKLYVINENMLIRRTGRHEPYSAVMMGYRTMITKGLKS